MSPRENEDGAVEAEQQTARTDAAAPTEGEDTPQSTEPTPDSAPGRPEAAPESRRARVVRLAACTVALAVAMTAGAVVIGSRDDGGVKAVASVPGTAPELLAGGISTKAFPRSRGT